MMWLKVNPDGTPSVEGKTKPYCYHIDQFSELQPLIHKVMEYGKAMGLEMIQGDHEDAPGQLELNFMFDRAELTADRLDHLPPDLPSGGPGNGGLRLLHAQALHGRVRQRLPPQHLACGRATRTCSCPRATTPASPARSGCGRSEGSSITFPRSPASPASTVNSYRRYWDAGFWAPVFADWGFQNRTTALRISAPGRFEYRSVDSAVNPYLSFAALIKAMEDGIKRKLDPGPPEERNIYDAIAGGKQVERIPRAFGAGAAGSGEGPVVRSALPGEMWNVFWHYKTDEWNRFIATVSDWDIETTWTSFPSARRAPEVTEFPVVNTGYCW